MKVICISQDGLRHASFILNPWTHLIVPAVIVALLLIGLSINQMLGLHSLDTTPKQVAMNTGEAEKIIQTLDQQMTAVGEIKKAYANYTVDIDTISARLGSLEAEIARLNALAKRVANKAQLDPTEFALDEPPAIGGYEILDKKLDAPIPANELLSSFSQVETSIDRQRVALESLQTVLEGIAFTKEFLPDFQPTSSGYISSRFGLRRDPFTGRSRMHKGVDFAGPSGTKIFSIAGGVVSFSQRKGGYGNVVEVDHGDGFISRYAHLKESLVKVGEVVNKGHNIALMGSTGRSTGPHLHLEVFKDGERIDPMTYLKLQQGKGS